MIVEIPFKTPSVNHLYFTWHNTRILTKEARILKKKIIDLIKENDEIFYYSNSLLKVKVEIYENWFCKNGKAKRADIANREKFLIDSVFEALGLDDRFIFEHTMIKIQSETEEKAVIEIDIL